MEIVVVDRLPADTAAAPAALGGPAAPIQSVDERARKQRAAQERQKQLMRTGRGR
jgi:hypothetical protein